MSFDNYATAACNYPWISIGTLNGDPLGEHCRGVHASLSKTSRNYIIREFREPDETCQSFHSRSMTRKERETSFQHGLSFSFFPATPFPFIPCLPFPFVGFGSFSNAPPRTYLEPTLPFRLLISSDWTF